MEELHSRMLSADPHMVRAQLSIPFSKSPKHGCPTISSVGFIGSRYWRLHRVRAGAHPLLPCTKLPWELRDGFFFLILR